MSAVMPSARAAPGRVGPSLAGGAWLAFAILATLPLFWFGLTGLAEAWARPEFSHGPVIPCLSFYMFLREMKAVPPPPAPVTDRWPGVVVIAAALAARRGRQPGADRPPGLLRADRLGGRAGAHLLRLPPRPRLLARGAAPGLHAAAAAVPLLAGQHHAAARLLRDRRGDAQARRRAGVSRRQHHRPRGLHAAGGRGLLRPALPVPDHELHLRLRGALPRAGLAQAGAALLRRADRGRHERGPHRHHRHPGRPLRHRPGRGLPARLRGLGGVPVLHRHPVPDGQGDAVDRRRPPAARAGARARLLRPRGAARRASASCRPPARWSPPG